MPYIGVSPSNGVRQTYDDTATAGQTSFSGSDNNSQTLTYTDSAYIDVYQNGILLVPSDYTATTGTTVVLDTGATVNDSVQMVVYDVFSVADTVSKADGGTFDGNVTMGGTLGVTGVPTFTGRSIHSGGITIANDGQIGSVGDADAMAISSSGVVTFSQPPVGAGGLVKLAKTTVSSSTALVAFNNSIITSAYDSYYILVQAVVPAANNTDLRARVSVDNGSNFITHECSLSYYQMNGTDSSRYNARTSIMLTEDENATSTKGMNGEITLYNVNGATLKVAKSHGWATNANGTSQYSYFGNTAIDTTSAINYIKIFGDQNILSGIFTIYGIAK